MRNLDNAVAVVTGAASGIGRATAITLAAKGCALAIADIDEAGLAETLRLLDGHANRHSSHVVDVADKQRMQAFADEVADAHGRVNVVINNAGVSVGAKLEDHSLEDFEWIVGINLWGVVYGCKFFLPHLQRAGWGTFVNLSSMFGLAGVPGQSSYCATKFAVRGFSESLALELVNENIDVICVHPGGIRTNIARNSRSKETPTHRRALEFFDKKAMPADKAATKIVSAIERRKTRVIITPEAWLTDVVKRVHPSVPPRLVDWALRKLIR